MYVNPPVAVVCVAECVLRQEDVPGAWLKGSNPSDLKLHQLRRWLQCLAAFTHGKKRAWLQGIAIGS